MRLLPPSRRIFTMRHFFLTALALSLGFASTHANQSQEKKPMNVKRITPVLLVNEIEPVILFWVDRLGFAKTIASVEKDAPPSMSAEARKGPTYLYIEVDNFDAVLAAMKDVKIVMPVRTAFYGMKEFAVQDPTGHFITFAQQV